MSLTVTGLYAQAVPCPAKAEIADVAEAHTAIIGTLKRERPASSSRDSATDAFADTDSDVNPARGIINGVLLAIPLWSVIGLLIWFVLER
jgi:hypothetical protein